MPARPSTYSEPSPPAGSGDEPVIEHEPRFVEEVVLRAIAARPQARLFFRERERVYRIADPESRARAFDELNVAWYQRLDLARPLRAALAEQPLVTAGVRRLAVGHPLLRRDAGAELLVRPVDPGEEPRAGRLLRLLFAPEELLAPERLVPFLRRELQHVADMIDPRFGYTPELPRGVGGPAYERLLRDRYRVVWDTTIDGRLARAGKLTPETRGERAAEFVRTFPRLGDQATSVFARFFDDPSPTHAAIVAFLVESAATGPAAACALCGFPTADLDPDLATLPVETRDEIRRDFPGWRPETGACRQCADLYRVRRLSTEALAELPGIR